MEFLHNKGIVHRDLKPDNFLLPKGPFENDRTIYLIDFGLSKRYKDAKTGMHIPYRDGKSLTGTPRFASLNTHLGMEHSRRDDLESLAYVLIYLCRGKLPWQGIVPPNNNSKEKEKLVIKKYMKTPLEELCSELPPQFAIYIKETRNLRFDDRPNYDKLKGLFVQALNLKGNINEIKFDWEINKHESEQKNSASLLKVCPPSPIKSDRPQVGSPERLQRGEFESPVINVERKENTFNKFSDDLEIKLISGGEKNAKMEKEGKGNINNEEKEKNENLKINNINNLSGKE